MNQQAYIILFYVDKYNINDQLFKFIFNINGIHYLKNRLFIYFFNFSLGYILIIIKLDINENNRKASFNKAFHLQNIK